MKNPAERGERHAVASRHGPIRASRLDLRHVTPENNFGSSSTCRNVVEVLREPSVQGSLRRADVYLEARRLAEARRLRNIVAFGCGGGDELAAHFDSSVYRAIGVDGASSAGFARARHPGLEWLDADFTDTRSLQGLKTTLDSSMPAVIVVDDLLARLFDVRPLLTLLRGLLAANDDRRALLSVPDHPHRRQDGCELSSNPAHFREWTRDEFIQMLLHAGFEVAPADVDDSTLLGVGTVEIAFDSQRYLALLNEAGLAGERGLPDHLLLTGELHGIVPAGGIGTFIDEQEQLFEPHKTIVLLATDHDIDSRMRKKRRFVVLQDLVDVPHRVPLEDRALAAVQQMLFYLPDMRTVQYQDYQGIGCRVAQAKRSGFIADSVSTVVHCHGNTHYLENANRTWSGRTHLGMAEKEKISIERADRVVFPSAFLRGLYADTGIATSHPNAHVRHYPFTRPFPADYSIDRLDTLLFYGKRSIMKGYKLFIEALIQPDAAEWRRKGVRRVIFVSPTKEERKECRKQVRDLARLYEVEEVTGLARTEVIDYIRSIAKSTLVVMPYLGDNYPFSVLDVVAANAFPVLARAGGLPETLPEEVREEFLTNPTPGDLRTKLLSLLTEEVAALIALRRRLAEGMTRRQAKINALAAEAPPAVPGFHDTRLRTTVIIPFYNTEITYVRDLIWALRQQSLPPDEILIVDDGSHLEYASALDILLAKLSAPELQLIRHARNKGLSAG
jgi:glycosyltransferase involved in cell wall biosynthesis